MEIPDKDWNAEKGIMEDTSLPEWQEYYRKLAEHEKIMADRRPQTKDFKDYTDFNLAITEWMRARLCDAPNKPGYYRANND